MGTRIGWVVVVALLGCGPGGGGSPDGGDLDLGGPADDLAAGSGDLAAVDLARPVGDAGACPGAALPTPQCQFGGAPGTCMTAAACGAIADHAAEPSTMCTGGQSCCIDAPDVADNPPVPTGWTLMTQAMVTSAMTSWAVAMLHDPVCYPMWSSTTRTFGAQLVLARVEWHPPDFQNSAIHRGVTLYVPQ